MPVHSEATTFAPGGDTVPRLRASALQSCWVETMNFGTRNCSRYASQVKTLTTQALEGWGGGLAVCWSLRRLVVSRVVPGGEGCNVYLKIYALEREGAQWLRDLGTWGEGPLQFRKNFKGICPGMICFTLADQPTLLVADDGNNRVQEVDVVSFSHVGYLHHPDIVKRPRAVAASRAHIAVSCWKKKSKGLHVVVLFDCVSRHVVGRIGGEYGGGFGMLKVPSGLGFSADGLELAVAEPGNSRVTLFRQEDGCFKFQRFFRCEGKRVWDVKSVPAGWIFASEEGVIVDRSSRAEPRLTLPFPCTALGVDGSLELIILDESGFKVLSAAPDMSLGWEACPINSWC